MGTLVAAVAMAVCMPVEWAALGRGVTLTAAALYQPQNTAALLGKRLESHPTVSVRPSLQEMPHAAPSTDDRTQPQTDQPTNAPVTVPAQDGTGGSIITRTLDPGDTLTHPVAVRNRSNRAVDIEAALATTFAGKFEANGEPEVLIVHTHTTEGYMTYDAGYYNAADRERTSDNSRNVCAAGQAVAATLQKAGIGVLQDTTVHDSPKYTGAYDRSAATVQKQLKKHPTIKVVLDLHRDAVMEGDTALVKPTVTVNGRAAAQMMFVVGVTHTAQLPHPYWEQNLALAAQWQKALTDLSPGLMRPLNTVQSRYNQHLAPGYLLVEVGSEGNTVDEAVYAGQLLGQTLADLLKK